MKPDQQPTSEEPSRWTIQDQINSYCQAEGIKLTPEEIQMVANQNESKPETRLPLELAQKVWPVEVLREMAGLGEYQDQPPDERWNESSSLTRIAGDQPQPPNPAEA